MQSRDFCASEEQCLKERAPGCTSTLRLHGFSLMEGFMRSGLDACESRTLVPGSLRASSVAITRLVCLSAVLLRSRSLLFPHPHSSFAPYLEKSRFPMLFLASEPCPRSCTCRQTPWTCSGRMSVVADGDRWIRFRPSGNTPQVSSSGRQRRLSLFPIPVTSM